MAASKLQNVGPIASMCSTLCLSSRTGDVLAESGQNRQVKVQGDTVWTNSAGPTTFVSKLETQLDVGGK